MKISASAPLRADLAGGTIDLWPLYLLHPGASTVNVALDLRARADFEPGGERWVLRADDLGARRSIAAGGLSRALRRTRPGDPFALVLRALEHHEPARVGRVSTSVEGPPGGGIGGSSALLIALLGLTARLAERRLRRDGLAELARDLEASILGLPTGVQDYYPAIHGGALQLLYGPGAARVVRLDTDLEGLESRLVLAYSGKAHSSAPSNWGLYRRRLEGDPVAVDAFARITTAADRAATAMARSDWSALGRAMNADWKARKDLDPGLCPPDLAALERAAERVGVGGAKGCGAASGGCMLFLLRSPDDRERLAHELAEVGARVLDFSIARSGLRVSVRPATP